MVDLDLDAARAGLLQPVDQLDADRAAVLLQPQLAQPPRPHEPEVAVDVADRKPEEEAHGGGVDGANHPPVERVRAVALVALDPVDAGARVPREAHELGRVVLAVAVRIEDPVSPSRLEPRPQRPAVSTISGVLHHPQARLPPRRLPQPLQRVVGGPVVDDDDLTLHVELVERRPGALDQAHDGRRVVVTEQTCRDGLRGVQASAAHTRSTSSPVSSG
jgi:hypothetical protein